MTNKTFMNSGYARVAGDNYKTIDSRCTYAFLEHFHPTGMCVDVCSPSGSGIVDTLLDCGYLALGLPDAFAEHLGYGAEWIISNPPYTRDLVDKIIWRQIKRLIDGEVKGVAMLMRWQFDHSASRRLMFALNDYYFGQIKTLFRPRWFEKRPGDSQGMHPFIWHIWKIGGPYYSHVVLHSDGRKEQEKNEQKSP